MARTTFPILKIYGPGSSALYTVPSGKYAILDCVMSGSSDGFGKVRIDGNDTITGLAGGITHIRVPGVVCPTGTTIQCFATGGVGGALVTGFIYDN